MLYADLSICMGKTTPWVLRCRSYEWLRTKIDELTYFFTSEEIKYMNPQIFSSSDKFTPRLWFKWSWLHIAGHIIAFNKTKAVEKKNLLEKDRSIKVVKKNDDLKNLLICVPKFYTWAISCSDEPAILAYFCTSDRCLGFKSLDNFSSSHIP